LIPRYRIKKLIMGRGAISNADKWRIKVSAIDAATLGTFTAPTDAAWLQRL